MRIVECLVYIEAVFYSLWEDQFKESLHLPATFTPLVSSKSHIPLDKISLFVNRV